MDRLLNALADDNFSIAPVTYRGSYEYRKAIKEAYGTAEALEEKLNDEEKNLFDKFRDAQSDSEHIYEVDRFVRGYRIGELMMLEVFTGSNDLVLSKEDE